MRKDEARKQIVENPGKYLHPDKQTERKGAGRDDNPSYICPICKSGTGDKGTGITSRDGVHFTCWAGCFTNSDVIDIIGLANGLKSYPEKLKKACEEYGIDYNSLEDDYQSSSRKIIDWNDPLSDDEPPEREPAKEEPEQDYSEFYERCRKERQEKKIDYLTNRGISEKLQDLFFIGYHPEWRSIKSSDYTRPTERIIIPTSKSSYLARALDDKTRNPKMHEGKNHLFNINALQSKGPVFVVEGEIDALSVIQVGYNAIALGGTGGYSLLLSVLEENRPEYPILIALDNDEAGEKTAGKLLSALEAKGIEAFKVNIAGDCKDPNERLIKDKDGLIEAIEQAINECKGAKERKKEEYLKTNMAECVNGFINGIKKSVDTPYYPTGFPTLDETLDGGLYAGLYIIGAISSLGKTTFALQIADQLALQGHDVLIFSLEMARNELIAKSLSRLTGQIVASGAYKQYEMRHAKTTRGITVYKRYKNYSKEEIDLINLATTYYRGYANHLYVKEGIGDVGVTEIRRSVEDHINITGNKPIVIVDYLQILAPYNDRATDKQNTDKAVLELKRLSRDKIIPIIGISSFNRDNYNNKVSMQAFKESGAIEYGSDVLIGLQLKGAGDNDFDVDFAKQQDPRKVEARILKNRNGQTGGSIDFNYTPKFNLFFEPTEEERKKDIIDWNDPISDDRPMTRREKQKKKLDEAFNETAYKGETTIRDMADWLDLTTKTIRDRIKEYGGYKIEPKTGMVKKELEEEKKE